MIVSRQKEAAIAIIIKIAKFIIVIATILVGHHPIRVQQKQPPQQAITQLLNHIVEVHQAASRHQAVNLTPHQAISRHPEVNHIHHQAVRKKLHQVASLVIHMMRRVITMQKISTMIIMTTSGIMKMQKTITMMLGMNSKWLIKYSIQ